MIIQEEINNLFRTDLKFTTLWVESNDEQRTKLKEFLAIVLDEFKRDYEKEIEEKENTYLDCEDELSRQRKTFELRIKKLENDLESVKLVSKERIKELEEENAELSRQLAEKRDLQLNSNALY